MRVNCGKGGGITKVVVLENRGGGSSKAITMLEHRVGGGGQ